MTRSDVGRGHPQYYQDMAEEIAEHTPQRLLRQPVQQPGESARPRNHDRAGDLGPNEPRRGRGGLRRRLRRHDHRAEPLLRSRGARRSRWCWPIRPARCWPTTFRPGRIGAGRLVGGRGDRRGFRAADRRSVAGAQCLHHRRRRKSRHRPQPAEERGHSGRLVDRNPRGGGVAILPRPDRVPSGSSRWPATRAASISRKCSTTIGWPIAVF